MTKQKMLCFCLTKCEAEKAAVRQVKAEEEEYALGVAIRCTQKQPEWICASVRIA